MTTWLADFHEKTDLNKYPVKLRTRGGIGYQLPTGEMVSNFVGHPVHYFDGVWKPITLQKHANGDLEGSDFAFKGGRVTHKGKELFQPKAVIYNGKRYPIQLAWRDNRLLCDFPFGTYEVEFRESGVRELLTLTDPVDAVISFDVPHAKNNLRKKDRHIVGEEIVADEFIITSDMKFPLVIDPDYSADTADDYVYGENATYATARSTSTTNVGSTSNVLLVGQYFTGGNYRVLRPGLKFNTSGIPDTDVVSDVVQKLTAVASSITVPNHFNVNIQKQDWSSQDPIGAGNREAFFDNCLSATLDAVWRNTSGMSLNTQYTSPSLDTSRVSKTGYTYYSLISSRDVSATSPGASDEFIQIASADHATSGYRPILTVTHAAAASGGFLMFF